MTEIPLPINCFYSFVNATDSILYRKATLNECRFSKSAGLFLLIVAIVSFIINIHSLITTRNNRQLLSRDRNLIVGMFISSLCVIIISLPSVVLQCFLCHRLCSTLICHIEGFNSFFNGCITMYMLVALSILRYITTANSSLSINFQNKLERHTLILIMISFILASIWTVPPIFGRMSAYVPEGLGFHCGINWFDITIPSRIYFFLLFIGVYFIPLIIIIYVNIYIKQTVYRLTHLHPTVLIEMENIHHQDGVRKHISNQSRNKEIQRLHRLYEDRRFVIATGRSLIIYLIGWTPYSIVALDQVFGDNFSLYHPWVMTICALLAKFSIIVNPIIYTIILKSQEVTVVTSQEELF
ncbi:unnamed protein product [Rotaria sp. Silwood1]|nr:unnamed protein product [Rotaria sp. Silwood1]